MNIRSVMTVTLFFQYRLKTSAQSFINKTKIYKNLKKTLRYGSYPWLHTFIRDDKKMMIYFLEKVKKSRFFVSITCVAAGKNQEVTIMLIRGCHVEPSELLIFGTIQKNWYSDTCYPVKQHLRPSRFASFPCRTTFCHHYHDIPNAHPKVFYRSHKAAKHILLALIFDLYLGMFLESWLTSWKKLTKNSYSRQRSRWMVICLDHYSPSANPYRLWYFSWSNRDHRSHLNPLSKDPLHWHTEALSKWIECLFDLMQPSKKGI